MKPWDLMEALGDLPQEYVSRALAEEIPQEQPDAENSRPSEMIEAILAPQKEETKESRRRTQIVRIAATAASTAACIAIAVGLLHILPGSRPPQGFSANVDELSGSGFESEIGSAADLVFDPMMEQETLAPLSCYTDPVSGITIFSLTPSKDGVSEFVQRYGTGFSENDCRNVTPAAVTEQYGITVFKSALGSTAILYRDTVKLVEDNGRLGATSFAVADLNADGDPELYFTVVHGGVIGSVQMFNTKTMEITALQGTCATAPLKLDLYHNALGIYAAKEILDENAALSAGEPNAVEYKPYAVAGGIFAASGEETVHLASRELYADGHYVVAWTNAGMYRFNGNCDFLHMYSISCSRPQAWQDNTIAAAAAAAGKDPAGAKDCRIISPASMFSDYGMKLYQFADGTALLRSGENYTVLCEGKITSFAAADLNHDGRAELYFVHGELERYLGVYDPGTNSVKDIPVQADGRLSLSANGFHLEVFAESVDAGFTRLEKIGPLTAGKSGAYIDKAR